jgi:hypothetical protein
MAKLFPEIVINYCRQCPHYHNTLGTPGNPICTCLMDGSPKDYWSKPDEFCCLSDYKGDGK